MSARRGCGIGTAIAFWVRATGRRVAGEADSLDVTWIFEDVTERHQAEEALLRAHEELEQRVVERTAELASANSQLQEEVFERMQAEQRIWHVAHHDGLTGLPNRTLLHDRLQQALAQAQRSQHRVAVMFLDLDRFKTVNDTLGHAVGDELLKHVAERLTGVVRAVDTVSRLGGDEFVVILHEVSSPDDAVQVAEKILGALAATVSIDSHQLRATPSIGISMFPDDGDEVFALMKNADTAMYHAKASGRNNFQFYAREMNEQAAHFFSLETRLRQAVENGQLLLHYQPLVDWPRHAVCGMEALVRWNDPEHGLVAPGEFIPVAEETGLIMPIGEWVLFEALRQNRAWQQEGRPLLPVSVNLSPRQFRQRDLVDILRRILTDTGQPARLLELEITESTLMHDIGETQAKLQEIAAMGVRLAIDDFGTGYSSLSYLKRFPVHKLKIDQSFVRDLKFNPEDAAIVKAIIGLAGSLGLDTLAEGVETREQLDILLGLGCERFQGYLFSRPLSPASADGIFRPLPGTGAEA
jgi:diguanylate cyclase (GGDEF)-like protein